MNLPESLRPRERIVIRMIMDTDSGGDAETMSIRTAQENLAGIARGTIVMNPLGRMHLTQQLSFHHASTSAEGRNLKTHWPRHWRQCCLLYSDSVPSSNYFLSVHGFCSAETFASVGRSFVMFVIYFISS